MAGKARAVKWQRTHVIKTGKKYHGENSPYWEHARKRQRVTDGELREIPLANPDVLEAPPEGGTLRDKLRKGLREIQFSPLERRVLALVGQGLTQEEIAKKLRRKRLTIRTVLARVEKKGADYVANLDHSGI